MSAKLCCLICNTQSAVYLKNSKKIFGEFTTLQSEKLLSTVVSEILETPLKENEIESDILCIKCYRLCIEYDLFHTKIIKLKKSLLSDFKKSMFIRKESGSIQGTKLTTPKKIVLPASKLQPLPPNYVLNMQNLANKGQFIQLSQNFNNSLSPQKSMPIITSTPSPTKNSQPNLQSNIQSPNNVVSVLKDMPKTTESIMTLNLGDLPQDFLTSAIITKIETASTDGLDDKNDEMEIDEDCSINMGVTSDNANKTDNSISTEGVQMPNNEHNYIALNVVTDRDEDNNELIFRELQIVNDTDENQDGGHTLVINGNQVMNGNEASILQLVSGQKLMYGDKEISLMVPESHSNDDQDSNDESQIELQVSGDEETANAIIAAAQEQGGAFIKVEGGEMFQVECIRSDNETNKFETMNDEILSIIKLDDDKLFTCLICEKNKVDTKKDVFRGDAENMMVHLKIEHSARLYICPICNVVVRRRSEYNKHMDEHSVRRDQSKHYECDVCNRKFLSKSLLREHMNSHNGVKPYTCAECKKQFSSKYTLQAHVKTHQDRPRPFKCGQCGKAFLTVQNLAQHEKIHSGIKAFICRVCDKAFGTQHNLEVHSVVHSGYKPHVCNICEKAFARRAELADHTRVHTGERPFACEVCGAAFSQRSNLHSHRRATHLDDRRHRCPHCTKNFKRRRLLDYHIKSCHTGERPLKCTLCPSTFVYPEHFRKHARAHSGLKPFLCEICGKSFNSRDNRNTHRFVHSDKKPYECYVCGSGYMRKNTLYAHMHSTGHLAESIVVNQPRVQNVDDKVMLESITLNENEVLEDEEIEFSQIDQKAEENQITGEGETALLTLNLDETLKTDGLLEASIAQAAENAQENAEGDIRIVQIELPDGNNGWVAINSWKT